MTTRLSDVLRFAELEEGDVFELAQFPGVRYTKMTKTIDGCGSGCSRTINAYLNDNGSDRFFIKNMKVRKVIKDVGNN